MNNEYAQSIRRTLKVVAGHNQGPVLARVTKQWVEPNSYFIDVEVLTAEGLPNPNWPKLARIACGRKFGIAGATMGLYAKIGEGALVRIGFYEHDRHRPYLEDVLAAEVTPPLAGMALVIDLGGAQITVTESGQVSIGGSSLSLGGGGVGISGGVVSVGAGKNEYGEGGQVNVTAEADATIKGENVILQGDTYSVVLGEPLIDLICSIKVNDNPIDEVGLLRQALTEQALAQKVKVE